MVQPKDIDKIKNPKCLLFCCQWSWSVRRLCNWGLVMKVGLQIRQITAKQFIPPHVHLLESLLTLNIWPWHGADLFWSRGRFSWMDLYFVCGNVSCCMEKQSCWNVAHPSMKRSMLLESFLCMVLYLHLVLLQMSHTGHCFVGTSCRMGLTDQCW